MLGTGESTRRRRRRHRIRSANHLTTLRRYTVSIRSRIATTAVATVGHHDHRPGGKIRTAASAATSTPTTAGIEALTPMVRAFMSVSAEQQRPQ
jgi:hypothetical protein